MKFFSFAWLGNFFCELHEKEEWAIFWGWVRTRNNAVCICNSDWDYTRALHGPWFSARAQTRPGTCKSLPMWAQSGGSNWDPSPAQAWKQFDLPNLAQPIHKSGRLRLERAVNSNLFQIAIINVLLAHALLSTLTFSNLYYKRASGRRRMTRHTEYEEHLFSCGILYLYFCKCNSDNCQEHLGADFVAGRVTCSPCPHFSGMLL